MEHKERTKSATIEKDRDLTHEKKKTKKKKEEKSKTDNVNSEVAFLTRFAEATINDETWKTQGQNFIWITDPKDVYVVAEVTDREKKSLDFIVQTQVGEVRKCKIAEIFPLNPPSYNLAEDVSTLYHLSTFAILHVLKMRYERNQLYTSCGPFLISMNPFVAIPKKFTEKKMKKYATSRRDQISPHLYGVAESVLSDLQRKSLNQTVLFIGETNSGKSWQFDEFIRYLEYSTQSDCKQIKDALQILNSFGNATTCQNSNASRFAKIVEFDFAFNRLIGCNIQALLLDISRVVDSKERNFHIFYQLLTCDEYRKKYKLKEVKDYELLKNEATEMNDSAEFVNLMKCFSNLAIPTEKLFAFVSLILHLSVKDFDAAVDLYPLLEKEVLSSMDISKQIMILYVHLFDSIVKALNSKLAPKQAVKSYLTMLDFPGFTESGTDFGHFSVNYFNDRFNSIINDIQFKKEQDLYILQRIDWKFIDFGPCLIKTEIADQIFADFPQGEIEIEHLGGKIKYGDASTWNSKNDLKDGLLKEIQPFKLNDKMNAFLENMTGILGKTKVSKIFCFAPNSYKKNGIISNKMLIGHIDKYNILPLLKISRKGFLDHFEPKEFYKRYFMLAKSEHLDEEEEMSAKCKLILRNCGLVSGKNYKIGKKLIVMKYGEIYALEDLRAERIMELILSLQCVARGTLARRKTLVLKEKREEKAFDTQFTKRTKRSATMTGASMETAMAMFKKKESFYDVLTKENRSTDDDDWMPSLNTSSTLRLKPNNPSSAASKKVEEEKKTNSELLLANNNLKKENQMMRRELENQAEQIRALQEKLEIALKDAESIKSQMKKSASRNTMTNPLPEPFGEPSHGLRRTNKMKPDLVDLDEVVSVVPEPTKNKEEKKSIDLDEDDLGLLGPTAGLLSKMKQPEKVDKVLPLEVKDEIEQEPAQETSENVKIIGHPVPPPLPPVLVFEPEPEQLVLVSTESELKLDTAIQQVTSPVLSPRENPTETVSSNLLVIRKEILNLTTSHRKRDREMKLQTLLRITKGSNTDTQGFSIDDLEKISMEKIFEAIEGGVDVEKNLNTLLTLAQQKVIVPNQKLKILSVLLGGEKSEVLLPVSELFTIFSNNREKVKICRSFDNFASLVDALKFKNDTVGYQVSNALLNIIYDKENLPFIAKTSIVDNCIEILRNDAHEGFVGNCLMILQLLSSYMHSKDKVALKDLIIKLKDPININSVTAIYNLLQGMEKDILIATGIDDFLIKCLFNEDPKVVIKALHTLTLVHDKIANEFCDSGKMGLARLMILIKSSNESIRFNTLVVLSQLSQHIPIRNAIRILDGIPLLVALLDSTDESILEKTCICLANLSISNSMNQVMLRQTNGLPPLIELMYHKNNGIQKHAANALSNLLTDSKNKAYIASVSPQAVSHIITLKNGGIVESKSMKIPRGRDRDEETEKERGLERNLSNAVLFSSFFKRN